MNSSFLVRPEAEQDLKEAFDWYESQAVGLGVEFLDAIDALVEVIAHSPRQYRKVYREIRRALLRRFPYGVFYVESASSVMVIAVIHGRRDPRRWKERA